MKKFGRYIVYLIVLSVFVLAMSVIIHAVLAKNDLSWVFYYVALDYLYYIPIITGLSILWPLVIKGRSEIESSITPAATGFFIIVYIFAVMAGCVAFQEIAVPKLYENAKYQSGLKAMHIRSQMATDKTGKRFSMAEFSNLAALPHKENIAFAMGRSFVYFQKMFKKGGSYYVVGFRMIAYQDGGKALDYVYTCDYAKIVNSDEILLVNPMFQQFSGGKAVKSYRTGGVKSVPLVYDANGIYSLSQDSASKASSLVDIFLYNNYVYSSKINFFHVGNMVFNKIAYYITVILILIILSSFGSSFRSQRTLFRDYFQTISFYVISFLGVALMYDILIAAINMIYGLVV